MSDLVEMVQKAMAFEMNRKEDGWVHYEHEARAAIVAVAEWLAQSEDRECNPLQALAAALRAAGDRR